MSRDNMLAEAIKAADSADPLAAFRELIDSKQISPEQFVRVRSVIQQMPQGFVEQVAATLDKSVSEAFAELQPNYISAQEFNDAYRAQQAPAKAPKKEKNDTQDA